MTKPTSALRRCAAGALFLFVLIAAVIVTRRHSSSPHDVEHPPVEIVPPAEVSPAEAPAPDFPEQAILRPLPVSTASEHHEWTEGDASDPKVIELIAHNPDEAIRMIEENERIHRRQLVYRKDTAAAVVQRARATGEPVRFLTLPGLDGSELMFEIESAELVPSGQSGTFTGQLAGKPNSQISLAFKFGREAFTVISPDDHLYLQADPREPGEIIVKALDPSTYIQGVCGNPDHQH